MPDPAPEPQQRDSMGDVLLAVLQDHEFQPRIQKTGNHLELVIPISVELSERLVSDLLDWQTDQENHTHTSGGYCFICSQQEAT
jgi:hypothetical protein